MFHMLHWTAPFYPYGGNSNLNREGGRKGGEGRGGEGGREGGEGRDGGREGKGRRKRKEGREEKQNWKVFNKNRKR
jgi:hypothetical protein